jgi:hypothetical protein
MSKYLSCRVSLYDPIAFQTCLGRSPGPPIDDRSTIRNGLATQYFVTL